jgi:hypothetical protein
MNRRGRRQQTRLWAETSLGRVVRGAYAARRRSIFDALLAACVPTIALLLGWAAAATVHAALVDAPMVKAAFATVFAAVLATEITAAALIAAARAALCLARDLGRHRCGVLLALVTLAACAVTAAIALSGESQAGLPVALTIFLAMAMVRWRFAQLYLADGSPHLRDFDAEVLQLRLLLSPQRFAREIDHEA